MTSLSTSSSSLLCCPTLHRRSQYHQFIINFFIIIIIISIIISNSSWPYMIMSHKSVVVAKCINRTREKSTPNEFSDFLKTAQSYHYITLHYIKCLVPGLQQTGPARQYSSRYPYPIISIITVYNYYNHRNYNTRGSQKVLSLIYS